MNRRGFLTSVLLAPVVRPVRMMRTPVFTWKQLYVEITLHVIPNLVNGVFKTDFLLQKARESQLEQARCDLARSFYV